MTLLSVLRSLLQQGSELNLLTQEKSLEDTKTQLIRLDHKQSNCGFNTIRESVLWSLN